MNKAFSVDKFTGRQDPKQEYMSYHTDNHESANNIELLNMV